MKKKVESIVDNIKLKYKSFDNPDFSFVKNTASAKPYSSIITDMASVFEITEITDLNDDVSFVYLLSKSGNQWMLQISMVGPYASLFRLKGTTVVEVLDHESVSLTELEKKVETNLQRNGITLMSKHFLSQKISLKLFNTEPENVRIYQALFSDTDVLPWERGFQRAK